MNILFLGILLFFISFLIHILVWKICLPKNHTVRLLQIFFGVFIAALYLLRNNLVLPCENLYLSILFTSLTLAYISNYSAVEVDSPSLVIVGAIASSGSEGLSKDILKEKLNDRVLVIPRINDLLRGGMIYLDGDRYKLHPKGDFIARIFIAFRNILGIERKGG